jgi:Cdc6-like AAA superfamily ATPase
MADAQRMQGELLPEAITADAGPGIGPEPEWIMLRAKAGQVFRPGSPVDEKEMLQGRTREIDRVLDVVGHPGRHAIIFGERGVGKTSLANVLEGILVPLRAEQVLAPRVNCGSRDTFASACLMAFESMGKVETRETAGFVTEITEERSSAAELLRGREVTVDTVRRALGLLAEDLLPILIFDEFDRLQDGPRCEFADLIKSLADNAIHATIVLVGVAETVDQLIEAHQSIARAVVEIRMERMKPSEIRGIVTTGLKQLGMTTDRAAVDRIALLARGLPYYAHLLGLNGARTALGDASLHLSVEHVERAIGDALEDAQQHIKNAYHQATSSPRPEHLFEDVLLACALAPVDDLGTFSPKDICEPMRLITGKVYKIPSFSQHLSDFCSDVRGHVLHRSGVPRRFRYRFTDSLLQPHVIMRGVRRNRIPEDYLKEV